MPNWEIQGTHRLYCEADLLFFEIHGMFELDDMKRMYLATDSIVAAYGYSLSVFDARKAAGSSPAARRHVGERSRVGFEDGAAAIVGASFPMRAMVKLIRNGSSLIGRPMPPMGFFPEPEEALQWLASQRVHFRAKLGLPR